MWGQRFSAAAELPLGAERHVSAGSTRVADLISYDFLDTRIYANATVTVRSSKGTEEGEAPMSFTIFYAYLRYCLIALLSVSLLAAAEYKGQVKFGGLPVPGATITASQGDKRFVAVSGQDGAYSIPDLSDGVWNVEVEMLGFTPLKQDVTVSAGMPAAELGSEDDVARRNESHRRACATAIDLVCAPARSDPNEYRGPDSAPRQ